MVALKELKGVSPFRKVAMGTWKTAKDPSVYSLIEVNIGPTLEEMERYSKKYDAKIGLNHVVGKVAAYCLERRPELNGMIRGSKIYLRESVRLNYLVNVPGEKTATGDAIKKATLSNCSIDHAEKKSVKEIAEEMDQLVIKVKGNKDKEMAKNMEMFKTMPWWMAGPYLDVASFLIYGLNLNLKFLGIPDDPFGSVIITNVGSLGIDQAWAPIVPYSRVPLVLSIGAVKKKPWVMEDDKIEVKKILPICITFDHRFIDGVHAAQMFKDCQECFNNPGEMIFNI